jgi:hypothetical protein
MFNDFQDMCYIAISKGNSMQLKSKFVTKKNHVYLIISLFAALGSLSATAESVEATASESEISPPAKSNLSSMDDRPQCPAPSRYDEVSGMCRSGYTYCPNGVTLLETTPTKCDDSLVGNTTSKNGFPNRTQTNFTLPGTR